MQPTNSYLLIIHYNTTYKIFPNSGRRPYLARKGEERREERKREKGAIFPCCGLVKRFGAERGKRRKRRKERKKREGRKGRRELFPSP